MTLTNLFVVAVLVGAVAVIGCDDDGGTGGSGGSAGTGGTGGTAGSGGTGGSPDAFCEGGDCATDTQKADDCEAFVADCVAQVGEAERDGCIQSAEFAFCAVNGGTGGTGGAGGMAGTGGAGGMAGTGGSGGMAGTGGSGGMAGTGGGGGTGGTLDPSILCDESLCLTDPTRKQLCEVGVAACIANNPPVQEEKCVVGVVAIICRK